MSHRQASLQPRLPDGATKVRLRRRLLRWFDHHARDLPWRRSPTLYHVWISEIMLQQTQVVTVIPYFQRFVDRFPDLASLAAANEQEVLRCWEGLGYYRRARQLHQAARRIVDEYGGEFPTRIDQVRGLPGIGRYTAGAILSIATGARHPILEANTVRVLSRLVAYRGDPAKSEGQKLLWSLSESLLPNKRAGEFNQALMELGSEICTPREPSCQVCPAAPLCVTHHLGLQAEIPIPKRKMRYEDVHEVAVVVRRAGRVLLRRCQPGERWAGLWDFPRFASSDERGEVLQRAAERHTLAAAGVDIRVERQLAVLKHGVTRFRITLTCLEAGYLGGTAAGPELIWRRPAELDEIPLSATGRKIARLIS